MNSSLSPVPSRDALRMVVCIFMLLFTQASAQEGNIRAKIRNGKLQSAELRLPEQADPVFMKRRGREVEEWVVFGISGGDIRFSGEDTCGYADLGQQTLTLCKQMIIRHSDTFFLYREPGGAYQLFRAMGDPLDAERRLLLPLLSFVQDSAHPLRLFIRPDTGPVDYPDAVRICAALMVIRKLYVEQ